MQYLLSGFASIAVLLGFLGVAWLCLRIPGRPVSVSEVGVVVATALIVAMVSLPVMSVSGPLTDAASERSRGFGGNAGRIRADDLRISLSGLTVRPEYIDGVTIGGNAETDWIHVSGLADGFVSFESGADDAAAYVDIAISTPRYGNGSVASVERVGALASHERFIGSIPVPENMPICVNCKSEGLAVEDQCIVTAPGAGHRRSFGMDGVELVEFPHRTLRFIPLTANYKLKQRIFSIRSFARSAPTGNAPAACEEFIEGAKQADMPTGFVYWPASGGGLQGILLDPASALSPESVPEAREFIRLLRGGPPVRLRLYRVRYAEIGGSLQPDVDEDLFERIAERRSFQIALREDGALSIAYDTPEYTQIHARNIANAIKAKSGPTKIHEPLLVMFDSTGLIESSASFADAVVKFDSLGTNIARATTGKVSIPILPARRTDLDNHFMVPQRAGQTEGAANVTWGKPFQLGRSVQITLKIDKLDKFAKLSPANFVLAICGIGFMFVCLWSMPSDRSSVCVVLALGVQALLALRLLISLSGEFVDANVSASSTAATSLMLFCAVPIVLRWASGSPLSVLQILSATLTLAFMVFTLMAAGAIALLAWIMVASAVGAIVVAALQQTLFRNVGLRLPLEAIQAYFHANRSLIWPLLVCALLVGVRVLLAVAGLKESFPILGTRISHSIWYIPGAVLVMAQMWSLREHFEADGQGMKYFLWVLLAFALLYILPAILISDVGIVVFGLGLLFYVMLDSVEWSQRADLLGTLGVFLLSVVMFWSALNWLQEGNGLAWAGLGLSSAGALAGLALHEFIPRTNGFAPILGRLRWSQGFLTIMALLVTFNLPTLDGGKPVQSHVQADAEKHAALEQQMAHDQNVLRLLFVLDPDRTREFGTSQSEGLSAALAHYADYTDCPKGEGWGCRLVGQTFLGVPKPTELLAVHMDDNVSAIHLTAQFGRAAAAAMILMLLGIAAVVGSARPTGVATRSETAGMPKDVASLRQTLQINSMMLAWMVAFVALFMILANYRVVPFTGQNIFFLSAASGSDALFSLTVFTLIACGMREGKPDA